MLDHAQIWEPFSEYHRICTQFSILNPLRCPVVLDISLDILHSLEES